MTISSIHDNAIFNIPFIKDQIIEQQNYVLQWT
jgi:hypothetical protein